MRGLLGGRLGMSAQTAEHAPQTHKPCNACGDVLPIDAFPTCNRATEHEKARRRGVCRKCHSAAVARAKRKRGAQPGNDNRSGVNEWWPTQRDEREIELMQLVEQHRIQVRDDDAWQALCKLVCRAPLQWYRRARALDRVVEKYRIGIPTRDGREALLALMAKGPPMSVTRAQ